jgi:pimeloyl-ACP methyl ester carboxylesterase
MADHRRHDNVAAIAAHILATAPPRFALVGLSMGGYIAFAIAREAPERVARLALLDTSARPDTAEQSERRRGMIALAEGGRFSELPDLLFPVFVHRNRQGDEALRAIVRTMAEETGPQAFVRQQRAIMTRPDCRPLLSSVRCPTLVLVGDGDELTPPALSEEIAAGIASAQLVRVPDCGHLSTLERPEAVNRALVEWLKE